MNKVYVVSTNNYHDAVSGGMGLDSNSVYKIDNKYYDCQVQFQQIQINQDSPKNQENFTVPNDIGELLVLVFDQSNEKSFNKIKSYHSKLVEESEGDESIVLIDVNKQSHDDKNSMDISIIEEWCVENAIEFIMLDNEKHKKYELQKEDGEDQRIKYGIDRVKELFETTMWSTMNYKTNNRPTNLNQDDDENNNNNNSSDNSNNNNNKVDAEVEKIEKDLAKVEIVNNVDEIMKESLKKVESFFDKQYQQQQSKKNGDGEDGDMDKVNEEFDQVALFESTLSHLQGIREQMKTFSDSDRREMAAKIALMFASKLDEDEDDI